MQGALKNQSHSVDGEWHVESSQIIRFSSLERRAHQLRGLRSLTLVKADLQQTSQAGVHEVRPDKRGRLGQKQVLASGRAFRHPSRPSTHKSLYQQCLEQQAVGS